MNKKELEIHNVLNSHDWREFVSQAMRYRVCKECKRIEFRCNDGLWLESAYDDPETSCIYESDQDRIAKIILDQTGVRL